MISALLILFTIVNIIDLIQTIIIIKKYSIKGESNPFIRLIYRIGKIPGIIIFKLLIIIAFIAIIHNIIILIVFNAFFLWVVYYNYDCLKEET
jgi:hypothetical protein